MRIQVVHHDDDFRSVAIGTVAQVAEKMSEVDSGTTSRGFDDGLAAERLYAEEDVGGPATLVLVIHTSRSTGRGWCRFKLTFLGAIRILPL